MRMLRYVPFIQRQHGTLLDPRIQQHVATSAPALVRHVLGVFPRTSSAGRLPRA